MPKTKAPPVNLDKYLEGRNHKYMTYEKASRLYGIPYWSFVSVAKMANVIGETLFPQFKNLPATETGRKFFLSWSHYIKLMRIENVDERHFYEIEAAKNDWSLTELKRQFDTSLYERLALSRDKENVKKLSTHG